MRHCGSIVVLGSLACLSFSNGADNWFAKRTKLDGSQITKRSSSMRMICSFRDQCIRFATS